MKYYIKNYTDQAFESEMDVETWLTDHLEEEFDEDLDMINEEIKINGATYSPSYVLRNVDPIKYRCDYADYVDSVMSIEIEEVEE